MVLKDMLIVLVGKAETIKTVLRGEPLVLMGISWCRMSE